jgi:hypothetical protein
MLATATSLTLNPMFMRHDLMIEMSRLEMAIEDMRSHPSANEPASVEPLQNKIQRISEALHRLSA